MLYNIYIVCMILYKKAQSGSIISVPSKEDPRYQSYSDSLQVYNGAMNDIKTGRGYEILPRVVSNEETQKSYNEWGKRDYSQLMYQLQNIKLPTTPNTISIATVGGDYKDLYKGTEDMKYGSIYSSDPNYDPWLRKGIEPVQIMFGGLTQDMPIYKKPTQKVVVEGSKEWEAMKNQQILKAVGLYDGEIDGVWGPKSQKAWDDYMKEDEGDNNEAVDKAYELISKEGPKKQEEKKENTYSTETVLVAEQVYIGRDRNGKPLYKTQYIRKKVGK